ncbi:MAG: nitrate reductase cytochrome c-type subunit [Cocleimonas sp.]|nr:nitrate reductase cytochrome c-type subunit [Cocleimonas sp.]
MLSSVLSLLILSLTSTAFAEEKVPPSHSEADTQVTNTVKKVESTATEPSKKITPPTTQQTAPKKATPAIEFVGVTSLRGEHGLKDISQIADNKQLPADSLPIARNYFQQPPLVPHRVREYKITRNNNKCLSCHSWKNYEKARATKISQTHFADRNGNAQSTVAARRYFCNQCHVPQVNAKPLVENGFKPVNELK